MARHMTKYRAKRQIIDGISFASQREAARYMQLKLLQKAGKIHYLTLQPKLPLRVNGDLVCNYIADFSYHEDGGGVVYEDSKGYRTPVYRLKRKLLLALVPGIDHREV